MDEQQPVTHADLERLRDRSNNSSPRSPRSTVPTANAPITNNQLRQAAKSEIAKAQQKIDQLSEAAKTEAEKRDREEAVINEAQEILKEATAQWKIYAQKTIEYEELKQRSVNYRDSMQREHDILTP